MEERTTRLSASEAARWSAVIPRTASLACAAAQRFFVFVATDRLGPRVLERRPLQRVVVLAGAFVDVSRQLIRRAPAKDADHECEREQSGERAHWSTSWRQLQQRSASSPSA